MIYIILKIVLAIYILWKISSSFDLAANYLTRDIGEGIKGPTINAIASSLPELFISSMFLFYYGDVRGFSAGYATIIGSSAFNIAVIPIVSFLVLFSKKKALTFKVDKDIIKQDGMYLIGAVILLMGAMYYGAIHQYFALVLIVFYIFYVKSLYKSRKDNETDTNKGNLVLLERSDGIFSDVLNLRLFRFLDNGKVNSITSLIVIILSITIIGYSCHILITSTESLSRILGVKLFFVSFFIASVASSLPDTFLSIKDALNGKTHDSFSNAYGSNMFDICIGLGLPLLIYTSINGSIITNFPITRIGNLGDSILDGNILLWSVILLFLLTVLSTLIYFFKSLRLRYAFLILLLYLLFMFGLIIF